MTSKRILRERVRQAVATT